MTDGALIQSDANPADANGGAPSDGSPKDGPYAAPAEIIAFLNELLEAERAGAKVALDSARDAQTTYQTTYQTTSQTAFQSASLADLLEHIRHDEARWCAMLLRQIGRLGGAASPHMGAFHGKAMAIEDLVARLAFLNRGQGWVVRKLREMLPRVRDQELYADLAHMLSSHIANISLANAALA